MALVRITPDGARLSARLAHFLERTSLLALMLVANPMIANARAADSAPPSDDRAAAPSGTGATAALTSDDIVVTATKFGNSLDKSAVTAVALGSETLEANRIVEIKDIAALSPGVVFHSPANFSTVNIRGIGTTFATAGLENSVATYIDGVYLQRQNGAMVDLLDVQSVNVLKGPQGTLYGRNATGGVVLINTADPEVGVLEGSLVGEYGRFNEYRGQAVLNVPVASNLALRFAGQLKGNDGYLRNVQTNNMEGINRARYFRAKVMWEPAPGLTLKYGFEYFNQHNERYQTKLLAGGKLCTACIFVPGQIVPNDATDGFYTTSKSDGLYNDNHFTAHTFTLDYVDDHFTLTSVTGYRYQHTPMRNDLDFVYTNLLNGGIDERGPTFTNDTFVRTKLDGPLNGIFGASIMRERDNQRFRVYGGLVDGFFGPNSIGFNDNNVRINSYSAYGELTYKLESGLGFTGGVRYNRDEKSVHAASDLIFRAVLQVPPGGESFSRRAVFSSWTPRAVVFFENGGQYFFASYNRGEKSGAFPSPLSDPRVGAALPEKLDSFEIGAKNTFLGGRLRTNVAAFYGKYKDIQATIADSSKGIITLANAASAKVEGFELSADATPVPELNLSAGATYLHNRYGKFRTAPSFCPSATVGFDSCFLDISGTRLPNSPTWSGFVNASYTLGFANGWSARLGGNMQFTSDYDFVAGAGGPLHFDRQKGYTAVDLDLTIKLPNGTTEFGGYAKNVFGTHYYDYIASGSFGVYGTPSMPSTYGVRIKQSF